MKARDQRGRWKERGAGQEPLPLSPAPCSPGHCAFLPLQAPVSFLDICGVCFEVLLHSDPISPTSSWVPPDFGAQRMREAFSGSLLWNSSSVCSRVAAGLDLVGRKCLEYMVTVLGSYHLLLSPLIPAPHPGTLCPQHCLAQSRSSKCFPLWHDYIILEEAIVSSHAEFRALQRCLTSCHGCVLVLSELSRAVFLESSGR